MIAPHDHAVDEKAFGLPAVFPVAVFHQFEAPESFPRSRGQLEWTRIVQKNLELMDRAMELAMRTNPIGGIPRPRLMVFPEDGLFPLDSLGYIAQTLKGDRTAAAANAQGLCVSTSDLWVGRSLDHGPAPRSKRTSTSVGDHGPNGHETTGQFALRRLGNLAQKHGIFLVSTLYECDDRTSFVPKAKRRRKSKREDDPEVMGCK